MAKKRNPEYFRKIVIAAQKNKIGAFDDLLKEIEPFFHHLTRRLAPPEDEEENCQIARIKVWNALPRVDTSPARTIHALRYCILTISANAIRDAIRSSKKRQPITFTAYSEGEECRDKPIKKDLECLHDIPAKRVIQPSDSLDRTLSPFLKQYLAYIRQTGYINGAHRSIARANRTTRTQAANRWARHVENYRKKYPVE
jgi:DNA-directed RNA polymerase specialized sigma24 family protein